MAVHVPARNVPSVLVLDVPGLRIGVMKPGNRRLVSFEGINIKVDQ